MIFFFKWPDDILWPPETPTGHNPGVPVWKPPWFPPSLQLCPFLFLHCRGGVHAIRCRPEVCGPILWLGSSNVLLMSCQQRRKSGLLNFSTWPRTNQRKIGWGFFFFLPSLAFLMEDFKIHIAVPFLWSVSGNIVFTCMRVCRLPSFDWTPVLITGDSTALPVPFTGWTPQSKLT